MKFVSRHIKGFGRGKLLGFPTINLVIPDQFDLKEGIYAVRVEIEDRVFKGALHFGPIPTFGLNDNSLEVFLIDTEFDLVLGLDTSRIEVEVVKRLRDVESFNSKDDLVHQIADDVSRVRKVVYL